MEINGVDLGVAADPVKPYSEVAVQLERRTNTLHISFFGGQLDGVKVAIPDTELRRRSSWYLGDGFEPVNVDALAADILRPAADLVIEGVIVQPGRLALPPRP